MLLEQPTAGKRQTKLQVQPNASERIFFFRIILNKLSFDPKIEDADQKLSNQKNKILFSLLLGSEFGRLVFINCVSALLSTFYKYGFLKEKIPNT